MFIISLSTLAFLINSFIIYFFHYTIEVHGHISLINNSIVCSSLCLYGAMPRRRWMSDR